MRETADQWQLTMTCLIEAVQGQLCRSTPRSIRGRLADFGHHINSVRGAAARQALEREIEAYPEDSPPCRAALRRHVVASLEKSVAALEGLVKKTRKLRREWRKLERSSSSVPVRA